MSLLQGFMYLPKKTYLHRLDPRSKAFMLAFYSVTSILILNPLLLVLLVISNIPLAIIAKSLGRWVKTMKSIVFFAVLIFALNLLTSVTWNVEYALTMAARFVALTSAFSIFFLTTTPEDLALALEAGGVSREYSLMITMSLRFVPTLARDLQIVVDAYRSRGSKLDAKGLLNKVKAYTTLLTPLVVFEVRRSLMVAEALEARAFGATGKPTLYKRVKMTGEDYAFSLLWVALLVVIIALKITGVLY